MLINCSNFRGSASDKNFQDNLQNYSNVMPLGFSIVIKDFTATARNGSADTGIMSITGKPAMYSYLDTPNIYTNSSSMSYNNLKDMTGSKKLILNDRKKSLIYRWFVPKNIRRFIPTSQFGNPWNNGTVSIKSLIETIYGESNIMCPLHLFLTQDNLMADGGNAQIGYTIEYRFYAKFYGRIQDQDGTVNQTVVYKYKDDEDQTDRVKEIDISIEELEEMLANNYINDEGHK